MEDGPQYTRVQPANPADADGEWVRLAGRKEYLMPALNFKALRGLQDDLQALGNVGEPGAPALTKEKMDTVVKIIHSSLVRNYPDVTTEQVEELVDMANFRTVFGVLMGVSGLVRDGGPGKSVSAAAP